MVTTTYLTSGGGGGGGGGGGTPAVVMEVSFPPYGGPAWSPRVVFLVARTLVVGFGIDVALPESGLS